MPNVFRLAYVDLATPSLEQATGYYRDVIGATVIESGAGDTYLSLGLDHHNIALHAAPRPSLRSIGLQLSRDILLEDLAKRLRGSGMTVAAMTDPRPGVRALLEVQAGGHCFQLFQEMDMPAPGFAAAGIVPNRIGHLAVITPDAGKLLQFLTGELGFWKTDWFEEQVTFVTCNRDHHVLNIIEAPVTALHHLAFELRGRDHQITAVDQLAQQGLPVLWGPSRHTAGHNFASYHSGADGMLVEFYTDMDVFLPDLNSFEPRPWHGDLPQLPKHWSFNQMSRWETGFEFDFLTAAWGVEP